MDGEEIGVFRAFRFRVFPCVWVHFRVCGCRLGVSLLVCRWWQGVAGAGVGGVPDDRGQLRTVRTAQGVA